MTDEEIRILKYNFTNHRVVFYDGSDYFNVTAIPSKLIDPDNIGIPFIGAWLNGGKCVDLENAEFEQFFLLEPLLS